MIILKGFLMENTQEFYEKGWRLSVGIVLFNSKKKYFHGRKNR